MLQTDCIYQDSLSKMINSYMLRSPRRMLHALDYKQPTTYYKLHTTYSTIHTTYYAVRTFVAISLHEHRMQNFQYTRVRYVLQTIQASLKRCTIHTSQDARYTLSAMSFTLHYLDAMRPKASTYFTRYLTHKAQ